jgi:hypothetical protein
VHLLERKNFILIANICCILGINTAVLVTETAVLWTLNILFETFCMCLKFHSWSRLGFDPKILPSSIQCVRVETTNNSIES